MSSPGGVPGFAGSGDIARTMIAALDIVVDEVTPDLARAHVVISDKHLTPFGLVHGGLYATLAETLASIGGVANAQRHDVSWAVVGLENHTSFLRAAGPGATVHAEARPHHAGRRVQSWQTTMRDGDGRELAVSNVRLLVVSHDTG